MKNLKERTERISIDNTTMDIVLQMSQNTSGGDINPSAIACVMEMLNSQEWYTGVPGIVKLSICDSIGLYGENLYKLWNDCCRRDIKEMDKVLTNWIFGKLSREEIIKNVSQVSGKPFDGLISIETLLSKRLGEPIHGVTPEEAKNKSSRGLDKPQGKSRE